DAKPPRHDLKLEALADVLRGKLLVQIHCYRADELLNEMAMAKEFGYKVRAFHHALEAYKVADQLAAQGVAIATFSTGGAISRKPGTQFPGTRPSRCGKEYGWRSKATRKILPAA